MPVDMGATVVVTDCATVVVSDGSKKHLLNFFFGFESLKVFSIGI
jgi:hypothetical protein